jgi:CRP/FNR family transcriptional regulator, cyclic AMP receptor protein
MTIRKEAKTPNFLREVDLFEGLGSKTINQVFRLGLIQNFKPGDFIIREGRPGGNLHILVNGRAEVVKSVKGSKSKGRTLAKLKRGSAFGEMSVFDGAPYSASVRALEDCDVHITRGDDFKDFLRMNPGAGIDILSTLITSVSNRLRRANLTIAGLEKG